MTLHEELAAAGGILATRDHPELASSVSRAVHSGRLVRPVPGVVMAPGLMTDPDARVRAAALWRPDHPLCMEAAAHLTITRRERLPRIVLAGAHTAHYSGFEVQQRRVPPGWTMTRSGLIMTVPSLTAADLLCRNHASDLYDALRQRLVTLESVRAALDVTAHRRGTGHARQLLWLARENPWSDGEALMHSVFRAHGLRGWKGNLQVIAGGQVFYGDAVFRRSRVIVELDGREHHRSEHDQAADRTRRNILTSAGWRVLVITMDMLLASPDEMVNLVRHALAPNDR